MRFHNINEPKQLRVICFRQLICFQASSEASIALQNCV